MAMLYRWASNCNSKFWNCKFLITGKTPAGGNKKNVKMAVPLKHLSILGNVWNAFNKLWN